MRDLSKHTNLIKLNHSLSLATNEYVRFLRKELWAFFMPAFIINKKPAKPDNLRVFVFFLVLLKPLIGTMAGIEYQCN
jgi:hypothetical protein